MEGQPESWTGREGDPGRVWEERVLEEEEDGLVLDAAGGGALRAFR